MSDDYWKDKEIRNPSYTDYGYGPVMSGGEVYDKDGNYCGHIDPPGRRGVSGCSGYSGYSKK